MADLRYHPVAGDLGLVLDDQPPARALVVGDDVPPEVAAVPSVRHLAETDVALPTGVYSFAVDGDLVVMGVTVGSGPGAPVDAEWDADDDHPLVQAYGWLCAWWEDAVDIPAPRFTRGERVLTVPGGQEASVLSRQFDPPAWWYRVRLDERTVTMREASLAPPMTDDDPAEWITRPPSDTHRFAATLTRAKLRAKLTDTVYSFRATRTLFRPYQFRPVMRLIQGGSMRMLIADEVGLGKTIEAGLVWTELDARKLADRVLVVCPSMLVPKWRAEMDERFGFDLTTLDRAGLDTFLEQAESDRLPRRWHAVCSVERLRTWGGLDQLAEVPPHLDLVVVDEAHVFRNAGTRSHALGALLSDWASALVFLSATPLNLGNEDLYNLLELLAPGEFDNLFVLEERLAPNAVLNRVSASLLDRSVDNHQRLAWLADLDQLAFGPSIATRPEFDDLVRLLEQPALSPADVVAAKRSIAAMHALSAVVTRTRKVEVQDRKAVRAAVRIEVDWTPAERAFYLGFEAWQLERARIRGVPPGFATQMPLRLASTCIPAARSVVLNWDDTRRSTWRTDLLDPDEDDDVAPDEPVVEDLPPPPELVELAADVGEVDTKFDAFIEHLLPIVAQDKRVLVFTFSRPTVAYLQRRLHDRVRLDVLHGDVDHERRHEVMRRFRQHELDVVVASRVASEGLDFEFCSAVVNYDLPWNPMEVEQRIGRIDRIGQVEDKVQVLNFVTEGTIETRIIERVHERIGVFEDSIGELEPILQSRLSDLRRACFDFELTDAERERRIDEVLTAIEEQRRSQDDLESAASYLSAADATEIDGLEDELVRQGRYVGQPELLLLLRDWTDGAPGASCVPSADGTHLVLRGTPRLSEHLRGVQTAGERSASEIDQLERLLRDGMEVDLVLDQELARTSGRPLLTTNHPLVRAALRVPGHEQARFAHLSLPSDELPPGRHLVLLALAEWNGLQPSVELWTGCAPVDGSDVAAAAGVGPALLAALAAGALQPAGPVEGSLAAPLRRAEAQLRRRQAEEEERRQRSNAALLETRRISLRETHARSVAQIQRRIDTLARDRKTRMIRLNEAQLAHQDQRLAEAERGLTAAEHGAMQVEALAVCTVEVVNP